MIKLNWQRRLLMLVWRLQRKIMICSALALATLAYLTFCWPDFDSSVPMTEAIDVSLSLLALVPISIGLVITVLILILND